MQVSFPVARSNSMVAFSPLSFRLEQQKETPKRSADKL